MTAFDILRAAVRRPRWVECAETPLNARAGDPPEPRQADGPFPPSDGIWLPRGQARAPGSREPSRLRRLGPVGFDHWRITRSPALPPWSNSGWGSFSQAV